MAKGTDSAVKASILESSFQQPKAPHQKDIPKMESETLHVKTRIPLMWNQIRIDALRWIKHLNEIPLFDA